MPSPNSPSSDTVNGYIATSVANYNLPPNTANIISGIVQTESGYNSNAIGQNTNGSKDFGLMQLNSNSFDSNGNFSPNSSVRGFAPLDPAQNIAGGVAYYNYLYQKNNGDEATTISQFHTGSGGIYDPAYVAKVMAGAKTSLTSGGPTIAGSQEKNIGGNNVSQIINPDPIPYQPLPVASITPGTYEALVVASSSTPDPAGLGNQPWYQDKNLVDANTETGNYPVSFQVYLDQANPASMLTNPTTGQPITVNLNCSISRYNISLKHLANMEPTRTGFHMTMWGMQADMITGEGSTGVFMNRFGLTDYFSLAGVPSYASTLVTNAYKLTNSGVDIYQVAAESGNPIPPANHAVAAVQQLAFSRSPTMDLQTNFEPFRIQAEDAFQEFLATFKMNATTWLHPSGFGFDYGNQSPDIPNPNQTAVFSQTVGASSDMVKARNNDVYKRGYVVMRFHNSQYLGFFKSLSFTMDANKPYQWHFNFVFQVERTLTLFYYATSGVLSNLVTGTIVRPGTGAIETPIAPVIGTQTFSGSVIPG